ncbi:MAG TPA: electron transfer flavoprotein subunit beta [Acidiphilium sp.]
MKAVVLLSAGLHPNAGTPMPVRAELQAIALARGLGCEITGLHAGAKNPAIADCLGHGLASITVLAIGAEDDPVAALAAEITAQKPDLVLTARRGQGGSDTGLLPYRLARACGLAIAADAIALSKAGEGRLSVVQSLPRGGRRKLDLKTPALITVHPSAPPPRPFVHRERLAGKIEEKPGVREAVEATVFEDRPYRPRPKLIGDGGAAGSAEERLRAATEVKSAGGTLMIDPDPAEAAAAILDYLRAFRP